MMALRKTGQLKLQLTPRSPVTLKAAGFWVAAVMFCETVLEGNRQVRVDCSAVLFVVLFSFYTQTFQLLLRVKKFI